jgi:UDP-N-acetylmuramoyl-L-alanyl-D-glutamate--2,6-diaminopimelate ligase
VIEPRVPVPIPLARVVERLDAAGFLGEAPAEDPMLEGVTADSRTVTAGDLFCAWAGFEVDAHHYVAAAAAAGAAAALVERRVESALPQVVVTAGRAAAALAADEIMGRPSEGLVVAGVTGTNGKTTTVWILRHLLGGRYRTASLGTVGAVTEGGVPLPGTESLTTPGPVGMARTMRTFVGHGTEAVAMEVSSHALDQARVQAIGFDAAVFTNLTRDHLDYHGSFERYRATKREFVELLRPDGVAVINADELAWDGLERRAPRALRFSVAGGRGSDDADVVARDLALSAQGAAFRLETFRGGADIELPLLGTYNVQNAVAAATACLGLGFELEEVAHGLAGAPQVPGRLEQVVAEPFRVIIDYAHTPDALERVLTTLRHVAEGRIITVFGAGGDRDAGKRPEMGRTVRALADVVVVTSDNPRRENPDAIIDEIVAGIDGDYERVTDRVEAIGRALDLAAPGDVVLLAGKGHETYQVLGTETVPLDERAVVREWLGGEKAP